jgi:hypothetical protein
MSKYQKKERVDFENIQPQNSSGQLFLANFACL